ncbi:MAG: phosphatidate cytidylyltransferase [Clostridia bacterium]|nr:phosphatidate cytidylyltransferase [Clostridia bacterium]
MDLLKRVISAAVMIAIVLSAIFIGSVTTLILVCVVCFLAMFDMVNALDKGGFKPNKIVLLIAATLIYPAVAFLGTKGIIILPALTFFVLAICTVFSKEVDIKTLISSSFTLIYPLLPGMLLVVLANNDLSDPMRQGIFLIFGAALCATLSDTFAYFIGIAIGKRKLCPQISPKKTVAGSVGGFIGGTIGGGTMYVISLYMHNTSIDLIHWLVIGFACGAFAQIGDLTASLIKRFCNVKDYGNYIPGHGGIMDRMDSIILCFIAMVAYVEIFVMRIL